MSLRVMSMVLGSFSPYLWLWDSDFLSLLVSFANSDIRFSWSFYPESPAFQTISWFTRRSRRYSSINSRAPLCSSPLQSPATDKSVWMITYTFRSGNHNSLVLKHRIIPMLLPSDAFAFFLLGWVPIIIPDSLYTTRPSVDYCPTNLTWLLPCVNWIHRVEYHPCPSMICVIIDNPPWLPANATWTCISWSAFPWEGYTPDTCVSSHFPFHWFV
jgi:hypothetical protein